MFIYASVLTVSPTLLLAVVVCFAGLTFWGTQVLRRLDLPGQTVVTVFPLGFIVGLAVQLLIANVLSYLIAPPSSFPLALVVQAVSLLAIWRRPTRRLTPAPPGAAALAALVAAVVLVTFAARAFTEFQQDNFREHWLDAATILDGNFPVRHPFDPDEPARYHYGTALLSAEIAWMGGSSVLWAPEFLKTALVSAFSVLVFGFVCEEQRDVRPALLAWAVFYFYVGLSGFLADLGAGLGPAALLTQAAEHGQHNQFFHFPSAALFVQPIAAGWPLAVGALYVLWRRQLAVDRATAIVVIVLLLALALSATPEFIATMGGIVLCIVATAVGPLRRSGSSSTMALVGVVAATLVGASLQGGVVTDLWRGAAQGAPSEFALRWPPGMVTGVDQILRIGTPAWLANIIVATDGLALLVPLAAVIALRHPTPRLLALLAVIATALVLSHFVSYPSGEFNTNRSLAFAIQLSLLLIFLHHFAGSMARGVVRWAVVAIALVGCVPAFLFDSLAVGRACGIGGPIEPSYLFWWDDPELLAAARWVRTVTPRGARIGTNEPMLLVALSGRFAPNGSVDTHGHLHPDGLSADPSQWTDASLARARLDAICLFRSPLFQQADIDAAALAREVAGGGPNVALVAQMLGPNTGALTTGAAASAVLALNFVLRGQPHLARLVRLESLGGPPSLRSALAEARAPDADAAGAGWMALNRAALQGMFPAGTRASWRYSEQISDDHLVRYPWYEHVAGDDGARQWLTPPPGPGADRVRCLLLKRPRDATGQSG